jgi:hypothetical protein
MTKGRGRGCFLTILAIAGLGTILILLNSYLSVMGEDVPSMTVQNDTSRTVSITYVHPNGDVSESTRFEVGAGYGITNVGVLQSHAENGCAPGTMIAYHGDEEIARLQGACDGSTWVIGSPAPSG